jgi:hypothetical protein
MRKNDEAQEIRTQAVQQNGIERNGQQDVDRPQHGQGAKSLGELG